MSCVVCAYAPPDCVSHAHHFMSVLTCPREQLPQRRQWHCVIVYAQLIIRCLFLLLKCAKLKSNRSGSSRNIIKTPHRARTITIIFAKCTPPRRGAFDVGAMRLGAYSPANIYHYTVYVVCTLYRFGVRGLQFAVRLCISAEARSRMTTIIVM